MLSVSQEASDGNARAASPASIVVTVFGAFARDHDGWFAISALVEMLGELDIEDQRIRAAVSRLKRRGVLIAERRGDAAGYAISPATRRVFDVGDARVFGTPPSGLEGWGLVSFSIPEHARNLRYLLRSRLIRVGAGHVDSGLWIAPKHVMKDIDVIVAELNVGEYLTTFIAEYHGYDELSHKVRQWWNLDELQHQYQAFIEAFSPVRQKWSQADSVDGAAAFADYTRTLTAWRPLPYLDPQLPTELLPSGWSGTSALELFQEIRTRLATPAAVFVDKLVNTVD